MRTGDRFVKVLAPANFIIVAYQANGQSKDSYDTNIRESNEAMHMHDVGAHGTSRVVDATCFEYNSLVLVSIWVGEASGPKNFERVFARL
jgi:hypothetical protein